MLTEATRTNLERKARVIDRVQMVGGKPFASWIDISPTELCNRSAGSHKACVFCPRIDPAVYPNQRLHMPLALAQKIGDELRALKYEGAVVLCGFGEPLLHPQIVELCERLCGPRLEIVTNGDRLSVPMIRALALGGVDYFVVSMYDGPHQVAKFHEMFADAGISPESYILRDRWQGVDEDFGLKLTNRGGTIDVGHQAPVDVNAACHYPAYSATIDWSGNFLLCVQDWTKKICYGNVASQSLLEIWNSPAMHKRRMKLIKGQRVDAPCSNCNACGTLHGASHAAAWSAR